MLVLANDLKSDIDIYWLSSYRINKQISCENQYELSCEGLSHLFESI